MPFQPGNPGKPKGALNKETLWINETLANNGFDYDLELVKALKARDFPMLDRLIKLAAHIANKPKERIEIAGIDELIINKYENQSDKLASQDAPQTPPDESKQG